MKMTRQVSNYNNSKRIKELGIKRDCFFYWIDSGDEMRLVDYDRAEYIHMHTYDGIDEYEDPRIGNAIHAYTVSELYEILFEIDPEFTFMPGIPPEEFANYIAEEIIKKKRLSK